jgi:amino acid permease
MPASGGIVSSTSGSASRSSGRTALAVILGIIALLFLVAAVIYLAEPAKSLPSFIPGHISSSNGHHPLRAVGSFVVAVAAAAAAWFTLAYKPKPQAAAAPDRESSPVGRG